MKRWILRLLVLVAVIAVAVPSVRADCGDVRYSCYYGSLAVKNFCLARSDSPGSSACIAEADAWYRECVKQGGCTGGSPWPEQPINPGG